MITGAWSVIYYGRPRASHDIDFVIDLAPVDIDRVLKIFQNLSPDFSFESDSIREAVEKKGIFQILHLPTFLKFDIWILKQDPFDQSRFRRRKKIKLLGQTMVIASREDTILQKLRWYKQAKIEKHIVDAAFVYKIQKDKLNLKYLQYWANKLKVNRFLKELGGINLEEYL